MLFKSTQVKLTYSSSGSNNISFENNANKPSYVVEFTNSTNVGIKWRVVKKYQLDVPSVSTTMNEVLQNLILEQPLTKYTLNGSLAKQKGKSQIEVHLGSNMANNWRSMRDQHDLNNNPSPNASTGFKLNKGNAYRKLDQSWPIYQPIDGTKHGKGKDSNGWNSEETTAAGDAPSVSGSGRSDSSENSKVTSTPNKHWKGSVFCLMKGKRRGMLSRSSIMLLFQPNKVKAYQNSGTYNRLIEPDKWESSSDLTNMTNLLKLLSSKNIKEKLGKGTASSQGSGGEMIKMFLNNYINSLKLTKLFFHFELLFEKSY